MNRKIWSVFAAILLMIANIGAAHAEENPKIYLNDGFGQYNTNIHEPEGYAVTSQDGLQIKEISAKNKVLYFDANDTTAVSKTFTTPIQDNSFVISAQITSYDKLPSMGVILLNGTTEYKIFEIQNGKITLNDGKYARCLRTKKTVRIDAVIDNKFGRIMLYGDGREKIAEWKMAQKGPKYTSIKLQQLSSEVPFALDSIVVYSGEKPDSDIADSSYNPRKGTSFFINQDASDHTYFNSKYISNSLSYPATTLVAKTGNSILAEALINWKNPDKGHRIIMTKNNDDTTYTDVYFDVALTERGRWMPNSKKAYKYYMLNGDLMITDQGLGGSVMMLRDTTSGTNADFTLKMQKGALYSHDNKPLTGKFEVNRSYHLECYVNLAQHVYDVYVDGELVGQELVIPASINKLSLYRTTLDNGKGSWIIGDWEFRGMEKPYKRELNENGDYVPVVTNTSQFPDNNVIKEYLKDKIVFHGDGQVLYKDSCKTPFSAKAVYQNNELYVAIEDFNFAYGTSIKYDEEQGIYLNGDKKFTASKPISPDGIKLYPAKELSIAVGFGAKHSGYGSMVIAAADGDDLIETSDKDMPWFDAIFYSEDKLNSPTMRFTDAQEISNFVFYDRPEAEQIEADFIKTLGEAPSHPRLMINSDDVARLRELLKTDSYYQAMFKNLMNQVDNHDMQREITRYSSNGGSNTMGVGDDMRTNGVATTFNNIEKIALAYILTGEEKYADKAIEHLMSVCTFPDINPSHIIDTGVWLRTIAIIYDWCYDVMTEEERAKAVEFIVEKGVKTVNKAYYSQLSSIGSGKGGWTFFQASSWFPTWKSNYTSFVLGGLIPASLAIAEHAPEAAFDTIKNSLRAFEYEHFGFYPGGVWLESKSYQKIINTHNALAIGSMMSCLGTAYKIPEYPGMHESLHAMMSYASLNSAFSFGDDSAKTAFGGVDGSYVFYADYYDDPVLSMWRQLMLPNEYSTKYTAPQWRVNNVDILDMLYYEPLAGDEVLQNLEKLRYFEGGEIFTLHENWLDNKSTFFAAAGGPTMHYHRHYDFGDFLFEKDGVQWTYEFGQGNYNVGSIYSRFGGRSEAHNTITINNSAEGSWYDNSFVPLIAQGEGSGGAYAVYDMKEVYAHHGTEKMERGFYVGDNYESLRIRDEMSFSKAVTGYWHMHTDATVRQLDETTFLLSKAGKSMILHANVEGEGFISEMSVGLARPLEETPVLDNDPSNKTDIKQIRIKFEGQGDINITAELYDYVRDVDTTPISQWIAPEKTVVEESGYDFDYDIYMDGAKLDSKEVIPVIDGAYPDFEIVPHDKNVKAEFEYIRVAEEPITVKLSSMDGTQTKYVLVKYSQYGEYVKNILYEDVEIVSYDVSSEPEPANNRTNLFDNDFTTRLSMYYDNATATFDLGEPKEIDGVAMGVWKGDAREYYFDFQVSDDGISWKTVGEYTSSGKTEDYEFYTFPREKVRYVRFVGHMNSVGDVNNILELRIIKRK